MTLALNLPGNVLKGKELDGASFQGVRNIQIPHIPQTSMREGIVAAFRGVRKEFAAYENEMRIVGKFTNIYVTPVVLLDVSDHSPRHAERAQKLSINEESSSVTVKKEVKRNANYSWDMYGAAVNMLPGIFADDTGATNDQKLFALQKFLQKNALPGVYSNENLVRNVRAVFETEEKEQTTAELKERLRAITRKLRG